MTTPPDDAASSTSIAAAGLPVPQAESTSFPAGTWSNRAELRAQAARSHDFGVQFAERIAPGGWTPEKNADLLAKARQFDAVYIEHSDRREASKKATEAFWALVDDTTVFRKQLAAGLRSATQGSRSPLRDARLQQEKTKVPKELAVWLEEVLTQVKLHKAALAPRFPADPVELTQAYAARLTDAIGVQTRNREQVFDLAKKKTDARVQLAAAINDQRFAAMIAFPGDKVLLGHFTPFWVKRRRKKKPSPVQPDPAALAAKAGG